MATPADSSLAPPVVVITGASSGIGLALATVLAAHQVSLVLTARGNAQLDRIGEFLASVGASVRVHACDVADVRAMDAAFAASRQLGQLVGVVNNAGVLDPVGSVAQLDAGELERHLRTNVVGVVTGIGLALKYRTADQPLRIVSISSGAATRPFRGWAAYCSSKAAVNAVTEVASLESSNAATSIVSVAPGIIETAMQRTIRSADKGRFPDVERFIELKDKGLLLHPVESAAALAWLTLAAPMSLSGTFVDARSDEVLAAVREWLAERGELSRQAMAAARGWFDALEPGR